MSSSLLRLLRPGKHLRSFCASNVKQGCNGRPATGNIPSSVSLSTAIEMEKENAPVKEPVKLSKAMKAYLERAEAHDAFVSEQNVEYSIGIRHLANIMGEDPYTFTDEDRDKAIAYLFPSGLFEPRARPQMKHPEEVFKKRKDAEFEKSGRPFHTLFYTVLPNYYEVLHNITKEMFRLNDLSAKVNLFNLDTSEVKAVNFDGTEWISKEEFERKIIESIKDFHYDFFIKSMNRLIDHPMSSRAEEMIMSYRKPMASTGTVDVIPKLMYQDGRPYMTSVGKRKSSNASVTVYGNGTGKMMINGEDILYFSNLQDREQVIFPLKFTGLLGLVDVEAEVEGGGSTGQSGAIRYALAMCLRSFVDSDMVKIMRIAGLLTRDPRRRERKKPGQRGARAKFTWKKR